MSLPSPISVSSWDLDSSNPCLEGELQGKSLNSYCVSPWKLGAVSPCFQSCGRGAQCEIQLTLRCLWMSPVPATPSEPQLCPVLSCVSSTALQADSSHAGRSWDTSFLISPPSPLSIFSPTLVHPSRTPDLPKLLPPLILLPKHTQRLLFAAVCAFLWHPRCWGLGSVYSNQDTWSSWSSSPTPVPHSEWGEQIQSFPGCCLILCPETSSVSSSPLPCDVTGFNKPWLSPRTSYWLRGLWVFFHVCVSLQYKWMTFIKRESGQDFISLFSEKLVD